MMLILQIYWHCGSDAVVLQRCRDQFEAYSASFLIKKSHLLQQSLDRNLSRVACETASYSVMHAKNRVNGNGTVWQSIDVLDFSVIHLSAYERLQRRWQLSIGKSKMKTGDLTDIIIASDMFKDRAYHMLPYPHNYQYTLFNRTVVIMPFLYSAMGGGHSIVANRLIYLKACFWSFYVYFPNIIVVVMTRNEQIFVKNEVGLPFYSVELIDNLPKSDSLPLATLQLCKEKLISSSWDFDHIFFTESDQLLVMKDSQVLFNYLNVNPRHVLSPHRLMAYPPPVLSLFHKRVLEYNDNPFDWFDFHCCMPRQECTERNNWIHVKNNSVSIINIFGFHVPLGNTNFHTETFRACKLQQNLCNS
eukprot:gene14240-19108_t